MLREMSVHVETALRHVAEIQNAGSEAEAPSDSEREKLQRSCRGWLDCVHEYLFEGGAARPGVAAALDRLAAFLPEARRASWLRSTDEGHFATAMPPSIPPLVNDDAMPESPGGGLGRNRAVMEQPR
ncbi:hypothetical protein [Roseomonas rosulenta]|uniref:hypothetical protein n=1 Tax=Roseomonas rosulenta TaxID=2748667 RepID=UPI0018DF06BC|nr:hypothetical protein [Roseomonas rosulenta]